MSARSSSVSGVPRGQVVAVLLRDGWHGPVRDFVIGPLAFDHNEGAAALGLGFSFREDVDESAGAAHRGRWVTFSGPVSSLIAVQTRERERAA